jgi:hypothetical protein
MAQPQFQQQGGVVYSLQTLLANMDSPSKLIYAFVVILLIVSSFYFAQYSMLGVVVLNVLFMRGLKMGKMFLKNFILDLTLFTK